MIDLKVRGENDNKIRDVRIASKGKNPRELDKVQSELQELIDSLDVRLALSGHEIGNTADESLSFNINGKTMIRKEFDEEGFAEELLAILKNAPSNQISNQIRPSYPG